VAAEAGAFDTGLFAARAADRRGSLAGAVEGELFDSSGYVVAAPCPSLGTCRGAIDRPTRSKHAALRGRVEAEALPGLTFDVRGGFFHEDFNGGTTFTTATVRRLEYAAGGHWSTAEGTLDVTLFGHHGDFGQDRARLTSPNRGSETLGARQSVPTDDLGASAVWRSAPLSLAGTHTLSVGVDARWIDGETLEALFPSAPATAPEPSTVPGGPNNPIVARDAGGTQRLYGAFAQALYELSPALGGSLAVRYDRWENRAGSRFEQGWNGQTEAERFVDRAGGEISPKLGLRARLASWLSLRGAAYRSFRAPTLDELYRPFQVGTVLTDANENLSPERMRGGEVGVDLGTPRGPSLRVTGFWNELQDPIVNVTTGLDPDTGATRRQRQNLGTARIRGLQADAAWRFAPRWSAAAAYTLAEARVVDAPGQPQLVGKQLPQAPQHLATFSLGFDDARSAGASAQLRYLGRQYENDVNTLPMGEALVLDASAVWHATRRVDLYVAVENVLDETYLVGRAGVDTVGQPRFVHGGVRIRGGR
jgi:outer membrane receptor protein involved in Fe transport